MTLRIPLTSDQTLQVEFHEIERRLRRLEKSLNLGPGMGTVNIVSSVGGNNVNLTGIYKRLDAIEAQLANVDFDDLPNLGPVGSTAQKGLAPSPGLAEPPTGVAQHLLSEDAEWEFPLRGLAGVETSGEQTEPPYDVVGVTGGLHVSGPVSVGQLFVATARIMVLVPNGTLAVCEDDLSVAGLI